MITTGGKTMSVDKNNSNNMPDILSLNSKELIEWCNQRKKEMHLSNAKLANLTGVPEGTIDRILTGKNLEFRYSTVQPIIKLLIGIDEDVPINETKDYYTETIEGYKMIVNNKNLIIKEQQKAFEMLKIEKEYLKNNNAEKQKVIDELQKHISWLETLIDTRTSKK